MIPAREIGYSCMTYYIAGRWIMTLYYSGDFTRNEITHTSFYRLFESGEYCYKSKLFDSTGVGR
jgi:hypothetical protein